MEVFLGVIAILYGSGVLATAGGLLVQMDDYEDNPWWAKGKDFRYNGQYFLYALKLALLWPALLAKLFIKWALTPRK
jgi:hypothetical protein